CAWILASFTNSAQRPMSRLSSAVIAAPSPSSGSMPNCSSVFLASAVELICRCQAASFSIIGCGVRPGTTNPIQRADVVVRNSGPLLGGCVGGCPERRGRGHRQRLELAGADRFERGCGVEPLVPHPELHLEQH